MSWVVFALTIATGERIRCTTLLCRVVILSTFQRLLSSRYPWRHNVLLIWFVITCPFSCNFVLLFLPLYSWECCATNTRSRATHTNFSAVLSSPFLIASRSGQHWLSQAQTHYGPFLLSASPTRSGNCLTTSFDAHDENYNYWTLRRSTQGPPANLLACKLPVALLQ